MTPKGKSAGRVKKKQVTIWQLFRDSILAECRDWIIKHFDEPTLAHEMYRYMATTPAPHNDCYDCKKKPLAPAGTRRGR